MAILMRAQKRSHCFEGMCPAHRQAAGGAGGRENMSRSEAHWWELVWRRKAQCPFAHLYSPRVKKEIRPHPRKGARAQASPLTRSNLQSSLLCEAKQKGWENTAEQGKENSFHKIHRKSQQAFSLSRAGCLNLDRVPKLCNLQFLWELNNVFFKKQKKMLCLRYSSQ